MMLCSITSPLFDLHKLIRLIVRRLPPPLSSSNRLFEYIHRIKEEEEEYFILCLPSCLFLSHPKWEIERQQGWRTWISRTIAFFQSTYFPRIDRRINARVRRRKKERKKCRFTWCETRFPLVCGWLRSRYQRGAPTIRSARWIGGNRGDSWISLSRKTASVSSNKSALHSSPTSLSPLEQDDEFASLFPLDCYKTVRVITRFIRGDDFPRKPR